MMMPSSSQFLKKLSEICGEHLTFKLFKYILCVYLLYLQKTAHTRPKEKSGDPFSQLTFCGLKKVSFE